MRNRPAPPVFSWQLAQERVIRGKYRQVWAIIDKTIDWLLYGRLGACGVCRISIDAEIQVDEFLVLAITKTLVPGQLRFTKQEQQTLQEAW
jgi:hypothetical protein